MSFLERFFPITFGIGFLELPAWEFSDSLVSWRKQQTSRLVCRAVQCSFGDAVKLLEPLTTFRSRELIVSTDSEWAVYLNNRIRGTDAKPTVAYLAKTLGCRGIVAVNVPHCVKRLPGGSERGTYGGVQFELYGPEKAEFLNLIRGVSVIFEDRWRFDVVGEALPFEDTDRYSARKKVDRFTPEMLGEYCGNFGIHLDKEGFYREEAVIIESHITMPEGAESLSLVEARRKLGLDI